MQNSTLSAAADNTDAARQTKHLWWRIGALLMLVITLVLILISFLNYSNYRKNYLELNATRYMIMGKDLRQTIEGGLNIGIAPAANTHLLPTMQDLMQRQSGTRYIAIVDEFGVVAVQGNMPAQPAAEWKKRLKQTANDGIWQGGGADTFQIGVPFSNNFNIKIGAVVIGYDRLEIRAATRDMLRKLALSLLQTLLPCALFIFGGAYLLTRKLTRDLAQVSETLKRSLDEPVQAHVTADLLGADVAEHINTFTKLSYHAARELKQLELDAATGTQGGKP
ncbi:hypothetical protein [Janthinobacterium fluminis]|uniref:HAMP domain-containing protein n=1 Tax=Janthinobacterium fluminis TaxID=2987524 RepID=A0ABT5K013_9BURK|nr:hypothetical protein [Janthinobacterium fluminis]MDC8758304.1 hypothetical protein [Janthinobacterium fluminis]